MLVVVAGMGCSVTSADAAGTGVEAVELDEGFGEGDEEITISYDVTVALPSEFHQDEDEVRASHVVWEYVHSSIPGHN